MNSKYETVKLVMEANGWEYQSTEQYCGNTTQYYSYTKDAYGLRIMCEGDRVIRITVYRCGIKIGAATRIHNALKLLNNYDADYRNETGLAPRKDKL